VRVAVVGAGRIAEHHFRALAAVPGLEVAVCDRSAITAEFAADRFGLARHGSDFDALLREFRPEVVHVTTPVGAHVPLALASLAAGAHVLVEKPIAPSYSQWLELRAAAAAAGRWLVEDHAYHFCRPVERTLAWIASGVLGEVVHVDVSMCLDIAAPGSVFADTSFPHPSHAQAGGPISDFLPHLAALACLFVGPHRSARTLWRKRDPRSPAAFDELRSLVEAERATASLLFSAGAQPDGFLVRVLGTRRTALLNLFEGSVVVQRRWPGNSALTPFLNGVAGGWAGAADAARSLRAKLAGRPEAYGGLHALIARLYAALRAGEPPPIRVDQIDAVQRLIDDLTAELKDA
jgi:predicted dehydrogenase